MTLGVEYCRLMARYNAWQNHSIYHAALCLDDTARQEDRGAFWGGIQSTLAHLMWGDLVWISRFDGGAGADVDGRDASDRYDWPTLWHERPLLDARIAAWSWSILDDDLTGDVRWYSGFLKSEMTRPKALCVMQLFNHQTHHRGQVHAMLTAAGAHPDDTDLQLLPEEVPEWH
ncbi:MAG: damage-inducible protein DinB [Rhodobacteraceae bacterium]|nr:damage-inducible protein DinB [Paracoccaceae bacterium]